LFNDYNYRYDRASYYNNKEDWYRPCDRILYDILYLYIVKDQSRNLIETTN